MIRSAKSPAVSTIPAGMAFADALAAGLLARFADDITSLGSLRLLLPNRRAIRAMESAFLRQAGGKAMILPAMRPMGDVDEDERLLLGDLGDMGGRVDDPDMLPAIPAMRRLALLARQIMALPKGGASGDSIAPPQAVLLASELARLMDQVETEGLDFAGLVDLAPEELARHWQVTLDFLKIVTEHWPGLLASESAVNPAARRVRLIGDLAAAWKKSPPPGPVIAAGSTGSIPATAGLLRVISRLPRGEVVLPGLDRQMPDDAWEAITETHPQYMLKQLIQGFGVDRAEVTDWKTSAEFTRRAEQHSPRMALVREALAPAERTENWRNLANTFEARTKAEIRLVKCPGMREEAGAIALMMREALETAGKTAALITPDRQLARRVKSELARWDIEIDDSAGTPLAITPPATFLRLLAQAIAAELAPVPLLALLKHPLMAAGTARGGFLEAIRRSEKRLREERQPDPGLNGLAALKKYGDKESAGAVKRLMGLLRPLQKTAGKKLVPLADLLEIFITAAEALAATDADTGAARLWAGEDGEATADFIAELRDAAPLFGRLDPAAFPALLDSLMAGEVVRRRWGSHPRLAIWGTIEARLQHADLLILGGLNENSWPPTAAVDPWMSRPMREKFGLPAPERRIGQSAHDFVQAMGADEVVLTRAEKVDGTPTVPSRWLLRLEALAGPLTGGTQPWLLWFEALDAAETPAPATPPRPTPPLAARPTKLSVTKIEEWMRDPYALYAGRILRLRPLRPIDHAPDAAERGTIIHKAVEDFMKDGGGSVEVFLEKGERAFGKALTQPVVWAFWWPRFQAIAETFVAIQKTRKNIFKSPGIEAEGRMPLDGLAVEFTLTAKADRIDIRLEDGSLEIIDYKTGGIPSGKQIAAGFAPQLPLEAVMAEAGAFAGLKAARVSSLQYWKLTGKEPAIEIKWPRDLDVAEETTRARDGLIRLVTLFADADTPYLSNPRPAFTGYGDYDHLARAKEWLDEDRPGSGQAAKKAGGS
ncbi:MAG: double-strand break repair protein AddB [Proteobacteria bacterium]|nr:double-strand break repair protein AddB [Pseudomonadota bacterium]